MKLAFHSLTLENFKTYPAQPQTLQLDLPGLTRIRGRNELEPRLGQNDVGKTQLFDAFTWCLFGRTVTNQRNTDICPWVGDGKPKVTLRLSTNGDQWTITRTAYPNRFLINDKDADDITDVIGITFEVFRHTILLGQGQPLFLDLAPREKMDLFSTTLDLERWEARSVKAAETADQYAAELQQVTGELHATEGAVNQIGGLLKQARARASEWEAERQANVKNRRSTIETLREKLNSVEKSRARYDLAYDSAETELKALIDKEAQSRKNVLGRTADYNEAALVLEDLKRQEIRLRREITGLGEADRCPTCGQSIKGTMLGAHKAEMARELDDLARSIKKQTQTCKTRLTTHQRAEAELAQLEQHSNTFRTKSAEARQQLEYYQRAVTDLTTQLQMAEGQHRDLSEAANPHLEQVQALRRKLSQLEVTLSELDKRIGVLERREARTRSWVQGFKQVRLYIIEEVLQELELATNALLPESGLDGWSVRYAVERETKSGAIQRGLNVTVLSPRNKEPVKWDVWGGGVGQRLRLVATLALSEVLLNHAGVQPSLEILDEPTRHLSEEGVSDLCEFLALRAGQLEKSIIFVDHKAIESGRFSEVITVVKNADGSHIT